MSIHEPVETMWGRSNGVIYFITDHKEHPTMVKIGFTRNRPEARLKALQTGSPVSLHLMGWIPAPTEAEREIHDVLRDYRTHGEWFYWSKYVSTTCSFMLGVSA